MRPFIGNEYAVVPAFVLHGHTLRIEIRVE